MSKYRRADGGGPQSRGPQSGGPQLAGSQPARPQPARPQRAGQARHPTPAVAALVGSGIPHTLHPYEHDPLSELNYGLEAAQAIGRPSAQVFKTLCVYADGALAMGVVPVGGKLDLKALARALGAKKVRLAPPDDAERVTGYVVGGISPIGGKRRLPLVVDSSAQNFAEIYVSGGQRGLDIGLSPSDLMSITGGTLAPIARCG